MRQKLTNVSNRWVGWGLYTLINQPSIGQISARPNNKCTIIATNQDDFWERLGDRSAVPAEIPHTNNAAGLISPGLSCGQTQVVNGRRSLSRTSHNPHRLTVLSQSKPNTHRLTVPSQSKPNPHRLTVPSQSKHAATNGSHQGALGASAERKPGGGAVILVKTYYTVSTQAQGNTIKTLINLLSLVNTWSYMQQDISTRGTHLMTF